MNKKSSMFITVLGSALGIYNANLYGFFAFLIAPLYFPLNNSLASYLAAMSAFAVSFIMRPLGGIIFGHIGDKYGRKKAFTLAILLTTLSTCCIGILPTYDTLSIAASLILMVCLALQGLCYAGTYTGASLLVAEHSKQHNIGFACSLLPTATTLSMGAAGVLSTICTLDALPLWAWRLPFLFPLIIGSFVFFRRTHIKETFTRDTARDQRQSKKFPLTEILRHQKKNFFCIIGLSATATAAFYVFMLYIMGLSTGTHPSLSPHQSMLINTGMLIQQIIFLPLMGAISDRIGTKRLMQYGSIGATLVAIPFFWFMHQHLSTQRVALVMLVFAVLHAAFVGPSGALFVALFPPHERYTGVGFGAALGSAAAGALTPIIVLLLMQLTHNGIAIALYLMFCYFIGWLCTYKAQLKP